MELLKLIIRNVFRHKLRSGLTIVGIAVAMLAFGVLRTLVSTWYVRAENSSENRLVTRNKISLIYTLPVAYRTKILQITGVSGVAYGMWYGGIYKDRKNFFAQLAISGTDYLGLYPEFVLSDSEKGAFDRERNSAIAGRRIAERFGWKIGDVIPLQGTIFPGNIELVLRGIYKGARPNVDETVFFFKWDYLNEILKKSFPDRADKVGWYVVRVKDADRAAEIAREVDTLFESSLAETITETEKAFQLGFIAMTNAIVGAVQIISIVVIGIILMVLANTMAMTARERSSEYAVLKTLGFPPWFLFLLISGESVAIAVLGGIAGAGLSFPGARLFQAQLESFLRVFIITPSTVALIVGVSFVVGLLAALPPAIRVSRMRIVEALRHIG
jgi:putative ABC transport system permease protein